MAKKEEENKVVLEREYVVPLRRKSMNTPQYKRTPKAMKVLKEFIAKHMKVDERDVNKVKLDMWLNEEMWMYGIRKPLNKVKVKAKKFSNGNVTVELAEIPEFLKWRIQKAEKAGKAGVEGKKPEEKPAEEKKEETKEEKEIKEEKKESVKEAGKIMAEHQHTEMKHVQTKEKPMIQRKALQK